MPGIEGRAEKASSSPAEATNIAATLRVKGCIAFICFPSLVDRSSVIPDDACVDACDDG
jgi:hypothetical protein